MNHLDTLQSDQNRDGISLLNRTIQSFNGAAFRFEKYYRDLEKRVKELDLELKVKNRQLEENLAEKEDVKNYLRNILDSLTTGVIVLDLEGSITTFNRAAENITGLHSEQVIGKNIREAGLIELIPDFHQHENVLFPIDQTEKIETEICRRGEAYCYVRLSMFVVKDPHGEKIGTALTLQDITRLKKLEEKANRKDRLSAMGEMAAEIAHEIRNPLGSIELFATTLKKDLKGLNELQSLAEHISSGVRSMNNIISNLLLFVSPKQKSEFGMIDICNILNESLFFSKHLLELNGHIRVITRFSQEPLWVNGDAELLKQAFLNLIINAVQAMVKGGSLCIEACKTVDNTHDGLSLVRIQIRDTGTGVSLENLKKIFDPFFTTKGNGTGLGLAIVHRILELHNGDIDMESTEGKGTVCTVTLPFWKRSLGEG